VDTNCVRIMPRMSVIRAIGLINPSKGSRTLFYCTDDAPLLEPGEMDRDEVLAGKVIFVDGFQLKAAIQAAWWGREARRPILMDAELADAGNDELADVATHVIASLSFARSRVGDCEPAEATRRLFKKLSAHDPDKVVAVTAGSKGSCFVTRSEEFHQPAFQVPVVDTTGCGDVFHGAFAFALAKGMELRKTAEFASAVAALKCRKLGGRAGIPSLAETERFLASNRPKRAQ
jgi:ribokinase